MITRRRWLAQGGCTLVLAGLSCTLGCQPKALTREQVLTALARGVALPAMRALADTDRRLLSVMRALPTAPRAEDLKEARKALAAALLAWERTYVFRSGPWVESNAFLRARFWPVRKSAFYELLRAEGPLDAARVAALGVDVKGLFALERLLWEKASDAPEGLFFMTQPERARSFAIALASDVQTRGDAAAALLADGSAFIHAFAARGQDSVALLVTQLVESVEAIFTDRLERVLGLYRNGRLKAGELPGDFSGLSTRLIATALHEIEALYLGARDDGLSALVKQAAPAIDAHLRSALRASLLSVEAIGAPLEQAVVNEAQKIELARDHVKALELAFKVELTSALAVTLSIAAGDGD